MQIVIYAGFQVYLTYTGYGFEALSMHTRSCDEFRLKVDTDAPGILVYSGFSGVLCLV